MATMRFDSKAEIDATDWALLELLQANARLSFAALGRKVRLSAPAVAERMKRLEERGVIRAYRTEINLAALGRNLRVSADPSGSTLWSGHWWFSLRISASSEESASTAARSTNESLSHPRTMPASRR